MLIEEQKKQILQMAADGVGYRETTKCVLASKQDIIDYRNELVETGWTPREEDTDAEWKENSCLWCGNEYQTASTGRKRKFCTDQCRRKYYMLYPVTPRSSTQCAYCGKVFEMINSKQKFCSHECYIKNRFWSREDAEQFVDALMTGEKINIPQWLRDKLKDQL